MSVELLSFLYKLFFFCAAHGILVLKVWHNRTQNWCRTSISIYRFSN